MSARKLGGKPLEQADPFTKQRQAEQDARLQAERDQIEDAAAARIQLGIILYELPELSFTKEPEPDDGSWWTAYPGRNRWRDSLTDAQILERQYKTVRQVPGYTLADFARDQVGTIERLLDPIRAYYGADDYDLQRGTQYRNFLQAYKAETEITSKETESAAVQQPSLQSILIQDGVKEDRAAELVRIILAIVREKQKGGATRAAIAFHILAEQNELNPRRLIKHTGLPAADLYRALLEAGLQKKELGSLQNFEQSVDTYSDQENRTRKAGDIPAKLAKEQ